MNQTLRARLERMEAELPAEQREALDVLRSVGLSKLARELGPAGAVEWLAQNGAAFDAAGCTDPELERMAEGEEPAEVLGPERAAGLLVALPALDGRQYANLEPGAA